VPSPICATHFISVHWLLTPENSSFSLEGRHPQKPVITQKTPA
jgi:hypothetical protein